jgi:hypothetical protein
VTLTPAASPPRARAAASALALAGLFLAPLGPAAWLLAAGLLWVALRPALRPAWSDQAFVLGLGLGLALAVLAGLALWQSSAVLQGRRWWWLEDDAMVSMRYGARLAAGKGLTWTGSERVEGYSNLLWTLGMAAIHALGAGKATASAWVLLAEGACLAWLALATRSLARHLGASALEASLAGAALALSYDQLAAALSGLESVAVAACSAQALAWAASPRRGDAWRALAMAALLPLLRADGALPALLVLALAWPRLGGGWRRWLAPGLVLAPGLAHLLWRHAYYGAWLPNTYTLKAGAWPGKWGGGAWKAGEALLRYPLVAVAAASSLAVRALRPYGAACALLLAYCAWTGADYFPFLRFFAPGWPLLFALGFASLGLRPWLARWRGPLAWALCLASFNAYLALPSLAQAGWAAARERMELGLRLQPLTASGGRLASAWAGAFFYYSDAEGVDLLGKCDPVVAGAAPSLPLEGVGHNKMALDWSLGVLKPRWVLLEAPAYSAADGAYLVAQYDQATAAHPLFIQHCLAHGRQVAPHWALYDCDWSPAGSVPERKATP